MFDDVRIIRDLEEKNLSEKVKNGRRKNEEKSYEVM